ncbi:hypothetical protein SAMN04488697_10860 [Pseudomonas sp. 43mfcvi1.1]|nr:hypothetical protein ATJ40_10860 [Pseudomonas sp. 43mfcvi1.1]SSB97431.1 hypothetical protein SAMN04488697_10860 [Pseudomonas sp. 43mfcvi1.1]
MDGLNGSKIRTIPKKPPYFIRLKNQAPMFFGILAQVAPRLEPNDQDGHVIVTAASDQGLIDIHDWQPLRCWPPITGLEMARPGHG